MISIHVPAMRSRRCVRAISARVNDVPGVQTLEIDLATKSIHVTGPADMGCPNWSTPPTAYWRVAPAATVAPGGVTTRPLRVWFTTTLTLLVVVAPPASCTVTRIAYVPARSNVARAVLAAAVPLWSNAGSVAPAGLDVVDQVYVSPAGPS